MKTKSLFALWFIILHSSFILSTHAQGTAFTYQGRLNVGGVPANGSNDFAFSVFLVASGGSPSAGPVKVDDVVVSNGLFTVTVDFGSGVFTGAVQWLEIEVRPGDSGGGYTTLSPRQPITPTPYAIHAASAAVATFANTGVWSGLNGVPAAFADGVDNDTTYSAGLGLSLVGTNFSLNPLFTDGRYWTLLGNPGTSAGANFLGTTDNQPLELKVNNTRALRIEPNSDESPNWIGGASSNYVDSGVVGATIAGGGGGGEAYFYYRHRIAGDFGFIGGGLNNFIGMATGGSDFGGATIAGGFHNTIGTNASGTFIGGGAGNQIQYFADFGAIGGGRGNMIGSAADHATIGGGEENVIQNHWAMIGGGHWNSNSALGGTIGGGYSNLASGAYTTIGGGVANVIQAGVSNATIGGGYDNNIESGATNPTIGGGFSNTIRSNSISGTIGGGSGNVIGSSANNSFVGGGYGNIVKADESVIVGGAGNFLDAGSDWSTISGGRSNHISIRTSAGTIAGGALNGLGAEADFAAIGGGEHNLISLSADHSTIGGGNGNRIGAQKATIGGGTSNLVQNHFAIIPGGFEAAAASFGQFTHASGGFDHVRGSAQASEYLLRSYSTNNSTFELFLDGFNQRMILPTNSVWTFLIHVSAISDKGDFAAYEVRGVVSAVGSIFLKMTDGSGTTVSTAPPIHETASAVTWQATPYVDVPNNEFRIAVSGGPGQVVKWLARVQTTELMQ